MKQHCSAWADRRLCFSISSPYNQNAASVMNPEYDQIGVWSELKLDIIRKYAVAYSTILNKGRLHHVYIDAFAGPGVHLSRASGEWVPGSPLNALSVKPPFKEFHFIDAES